jgi:4a-hydroxytetrahydrobiopterin dehydratase
MTERITARQFHEPLASKTEHAPSWWALADAEGNEADVCTWRSPG